MPVESISQRSESAADAVEMPASTAWPIVLAFGIALLFAGLVTSATVSVLGAIIAIPAAAGWFRDVLPHERHVFVQVETQVPVVTTTRREVARLEIAGAVRRAWLPLEIYPISAGIKGGLAGSVVMAALAMLYGILSRTGIWYPVNLLALGFYPAAASDTTAEIAAFQLPAFLIAVPIHLTTSLLVGLLYGAMLPMLPRRPILLGGFIAPVLWSGLIYGVLGIVNPVLNQRVDWFWFVLSQMGFGLVAGFVVSRQTRIHTPQQPPLAFRMGLEMSGMREEDRGDEGR